jgi:hypothetical protein
MRAIAASLLVALLLLGCSDRDEDLPAEDRRPDTPTPAGPALMDPPPGYLIDSSGARVEGGIGSSCWRRAGVQACRDYFGVRTNATRVSLEAGAQLAFEFEAGTPTDLSVDWTPADALASTPSGDYLEWSPKDGANYRGPSYTDPLVAPEEPGLYVLAVFGFFADGDVVYGFYVEVE